MSVDLSTTYLNLKLKTPLVVAACPVSNWTDTIALAEDCGAGALIIRSLFEEQLEQDAQRMQESLDVGSESFSEAASYFPNVDHGGTREHLMWVEKARARVEMPLIASLNARSRGNWIAFARQLEETGIDAIELNLYAVEADPGRSAAEVEKEQADIIREVCGSVSIPVSVKLSPFYTSLAHTLGHFDTLGPKGFVLFNRFLQPDIDPETEMLVTRMVMSRAEDIRLPLRWIALTHGRVQADLALSTGVHSGGDVVKALLAGAVTVQTAAALMTHGIAFLSVLLRHLTTWMENNGYDRLSDFRGKLSQKHIADPSSLERAHYVNLLYSKGAVPNGT